jgi:aminopeptidase N
MGVGDYAVVKDSYKGKEVSYYLDKEYAPVARRIFGYTPEMIAFYSKITGVDYPWVKYAQITAHDYVSGAMENTTATLHSDIAQQDARELTDGNRWESTIAHELFHQWFGDYVTTESWSNITLNESFANYSETLWDEYKHGKDAGDAQNFGDMLGYLESNSADKDLVRFHYNDKEDVFDAVSYNKGGRILHMLRNYVGDSAFFKALNLYLTSNRFKSAEAQQLRLAFEEVTGRDLNWYWNQWYYGAGNPNLDIAYSYDAAARKVQVIVKQTQANKVFKLPVAIDIYNGAIKTRYNVWAQNKADTFSFASASKPDLINFDGDKVLLCTKKENKTLDEYIHQYKYAGTYLDRREAIDFASTHQDDAKALTFLKSALRDKYDGLRSYAIGKLDVKNENVKNEVQQTLVDLAKNDLKRTVKTAAIAKLGEYRNPQFAPIFKTAINDSSYTVSGYALQGLMEIDSLSALNEAKRLAPQATRGKLGSVVASLLLDQATVDSIFTKFETMPLSQDKFSVLQSVADIVDKTMNMAIFKRGVDDIVAFRDAMPKALKVQTDPLINDIIIKVLSSRKKALGLTEQSDYLTSKLPNGGKKGF